MGIGARLLSSNQSPLPASSLPLRLHPRGMGKLSKQWPPPRAEPSDAAASEELAKEIQAAIAVSLERSSSRRQATREKTRRRKIKSKMWIAGIFSLDLRRRLPAPQPLPRALSEEERRDQLERARHESALRIQKFARRREAMRKRAKMKAPTFRPNEEEAEADLFPVNEEELSADEAARRRKSVDIKLPHSLVHSSKSHKELGDQVIKEAPPHLSTRKSSSIQQQAGEDPSPAPPLSDTGSSPTSEADPRKPPPKPPTSLPTSSPRRMRAGPREQSPASASEPPPAAFGSENLRKVDIEAAPAAPAALAASPAAAAPSGAEAEAGAQEEGEKYAPNYMQPKAPVANAFFKGFSDGFFEPDESCRPRHVACALFSAFFIWALTFAIVSYWGPSSFGHFAGVHTAVGSNPRTGPPHALLLALCFASALHGALGSLTSPTFEPLAREDAAVSTFIAGSFIMLTVMGGLFRVLRRLLRRRSLAQSHAQSLSTRLEEIKVEPMNTGIGSARPPLKEEEEDGRGAAAEAAAAAARAATAAAVAAEVSA